MKKLIMRGIAALSLLFGAYSTSMAQEMQIPQLPLEKEVIAGKLDNGLTYFIRHNENPKGQAEFFIAQKVGSMLEEDNQRGLAHFLEHMCFNGTEHFPGNQLVTWLESVGVKFGENLNAYTSIEETVYNISGVPVARTSVQDSCLLILHDWACALTLDPKEIDKERGVIHEEWRRSNAGQMRLMETLLPTIYPDSRYGYRLPIGTMEVVDNFPYQDLVDYYHKWYRPDQQGIIVVGDIDPAYIEAKIKELFSHIQMPENAASREYLPVDETPGTIFAIGKDKEMTMPIMSLNFKNENIILPREYRNTQIAFANSYINSMVCSMLGSRLNDIANTPGAEFANASLSIGDFFVSTTMGSVDLSVIAKENAIPAFKQAYRELLRASRGGFTIGEYERARAEFLSMIEKSYENRADRKSESFAREITRHFIDNEAMPGIETEKQIYDALAQQIDVNVINQYLPQLIGEDNRVFIGMFPEKEGFYVPTEEEFSQAISEVEAEELEPYKDEVREDPLIPNLPAPGKVKKTSTDEIWGTKVYTLSNGVNVVVKTTDFKANEIQFQAMALGNANSTLQGYDDATLRYMDAAAAGASYYNYSNSDVRKYLQGKQVGVSLSIDNYTRSVMGSSTVKDLPTLMELIYAQFTGFDLKEDEYIASRDATAGLLANQETDPQFIFAKNLRNELYKASALKMLSAEDVKNADRQSIINIVRGMMSNAADYTFYFVGNIDEATFIPLMEQYIATLPADAKKATKTYVSNPDYELTPGTRTVEAATKMETPQSWIFIAPIANVTYTAKNRIINDIASQVASKRLLEKIREEMGATYSIGAYGIMNRTGNMNTMIQAACPTDPAKRDEVIKEINAIFKSVAEGVTEDEIKPAVEFMLKQHEEDLKENSAWLGSMTATAINGVDVFHQLPEILPTITTADVANYMKEILENGSVVTVILNPEVTPAE